MGKRTVRRAWGATLAAALGLFLPWVAAAEGMPRYTVGQAWECTLAPPSRAEIAPLRFVVTGVATRRQISIRQNFQSNDPVISVQLTDPDPGVCDAVRRFDHLGFTEAGLNACRPVRLATEAPALSDADWDVAQAARVRWLVGMELHRAGVLDMPPSFYVVLEQRRRCG